MDDHDINWLGHDEYTYVLCTVQTLIMIYEFEGLFGLPTFACHYHLSINLNGQYTLIINVRLLGVNVDSICPFIKNRLHFPLVPTSASCVRVPHTLQGV